MGLTVEESKVYLLHPPLLNILSVTICYINKEKGPILWIPSPPLPQSSILP